MFSDDVKAVLKALTPMTLLALPAFLVTIHLKLLGKEVYCKFPCRYM